MLVLTSLWVLRIVEQLRGDMHMRVAFVWLCALQISCILSVSADFVSVCSTDVCVHLCVCVCVWVAVPALVIFIVALIRALLHYNWILKRTTNAGNVGWLPAWLPLPLPLPPPPFLFLISLVCLVDALWQLLPVPQLLSGFTSSCFACPQLLHLMRSV